jgi:hypothetical protein
LAHTEEKEMKKVSQNRRKWKDLGRSYQMLTRATELKEEMWKAHEQTHGSILPG